MQQVGKFKPNKISMHDVYGNVSEFTSTVNPELKNSIIVKGGSIYNFDDQFELSRQEYMASPNVSTGHVGFRCVKDL